jgi:hypothetical protein
MLLLVVVYALAGFAGTRVTASEGREGLSCDTVLGVASSGGEPAVGFGARLLDHVRARLR